VSDSSQPSRPTPRNQFSFSRLKTFDQCPLRYRLRYLKGMSEAFRSIEAHLGSSVHEVLEWLYRERDDHVDPDPQTMLERFAATWQDGRGDDLAVIRITDSEDDYLRRGREMLDRFYREVFVADRSTTVALEQRVGRRLTPEVVFTGFADRVGRTANGRLFVVDYKTSRSRGNGSDFSEGLQAPLYATCALDAHDDAEALAGYHYLQLGETSWRVVSRDHGAALLERFLALAEQALAATEFASRPGILCAWCGFNAVCPDARVPDDLSGGFELARSRHLPGG
jgi:putative RecB family exonuclease